MSEPVALRSPNWRWMVCGMLLLATMLNYMDRQTLSQTATEIKLELKLSQEQYGELEMGFGLAFATGAVLFGLLVDKVSVRWLYPAVLLGWSFAGVATAYAHVIGGQLVGALEPILGSPSKWLAEDVESGQAFLGLMVCRIVLGLFEAGQWPCALVTTQRILSRKDRSFGNSILQSGASVGAIVTPQIVKLMVTDEVGTWRGPFVVIGFVGMIWVVPWLLIIRRDDLTRRAPTAEGDAEGGQAAELTGARFWQCYGALVAMVISINLTWQYFRVWLPSLLREFHGYDSVFTNNFMSVYYVATDVGCIAVGVGVKALADRGHDVHRVRLGSFFLCAMLTSLAMFAAAMPKGFALLGLFLVIGFGALGLFPNYYSFTQELTSRHQGKISGSLGAITWIVTSIMQKYFGRWVDVTKSFASGITLAGVAPLVGLVLFWLLWNTGRPSEKTERPAES